MAVSFFKLSWPNFNKNRFCKICLILQPHLNWCVTVGICGLRCSTQNPCPLHLHCRRRQWTPQKSSTVHCMHSFRVTSLMQIWGKRYRSFSCIAVVKTLAFSRNAFNAIARSTLDDVLLSYITGVLEDLGSQQSVEENFDVEVFAEMLEAYVPGFAEIDRWSVALSLFILKQYILKMLNWIFFCITFFNCFSLNFFPSVKVCEMMFSLASKLASARTSGNALWRYSMCTFMSGLPFSNHFLIFLLQNNTLYWAAGLLDFYLVLLIINNKLLIFVYFKLVKTMLCRKEQKKLRWNLQRPVNIPKRESTVLTRRQRAPPQRFSLKNSS